MNSRLTSPRALAVLAATLAFTACSEPPVDTAAAAEAAEQAALAAGAQEYAPAALPAVAAAREALEAEMAAQEQKMALTRSFRRAQELAQAYLTSAEEAANAATAAYKQAQDETVGFMNEGWTLLGEIPDLMAATPRGRLTAQEMSALRADLASAEEKLKQADPLIPHGRYLEARQYASDAVESLRRIKAALTPPPVEGGA